jgi:hypothetical protein
MQANTDRVETKVFHVQYLYNIRAMAAQNLHIASANFEKNYAGEKADDAANNLLNAVREYKAADEAYKKA